MNDHIIDEIVGFYRVIALTPFRHTEGVAFDIFPMQYLPKIDGIEILEYVKSHSGLKDIPVVIVTTSDNPLNVLRCRHLKCDGYIVKPLDHTFVDQINNSIEKTFSLTL